MELDPDSRRFAIFPPLVSFPSSIQCYAKNHAALSEYVAPVASSLVGNQWRSFAPDVRSAVRGISSSLRRCALYLWSKKAIVSDAAVTGDCGTGNGGPPLISSLTFRYIIFPKVFAAKHARTPENMCVVFLFRFIMQGHQRHNHPSPAAGRESAPVCCWARRVVLPREEQK